ncbi:MAG: endonuclease [Rhizobiaceae bacterium]|jgi:predicted extracellular nuclease|nr:endonuclease [Rhizobiaceae bacterium]
MTIRLATFNVENLLSRFDFTGWRNDLQKDRALALFEIRDEATFQRLEQARMVATADDVRQLSALAIADTEADIIALQEVDDAKALDAFEFGYLFKMIGAGYRGKEVSHGNDTRGIDVGAMFREEAALGDTITLTDVTSHADLTYAKAGLFNAELASRGAKPDDRVFKRDCLQLKYTIGGRPFTLFVVHFKSMGGWRDGMPGREWTMPIRMAEAKAVRRIVENAFGGEERARKANWAICGDFNDYRERIVVEGGKRGGFTFRVEPEAVSSLNVLVDDGFAVNVVERLPALERWTLYHARGPQERHLCQLDYILLSPKLAHDNPQAVPDIIRAGQPFRVIAPEGQIIERYPRIGWDRPKASDHCPVVISLVVR